MPQVIQLLDRAGNLLATADVSPKNGGFAGNARLAEMPEATLRVFEEYESLVNQQVFGLLDRLEERVASMGVSAVFAGGRSAPVSDLQLFPGALTVFFRLARDPAPVRRAAAGSG